jgi:hypothetical protein
MTAGYLSFKIMIQKICRNRKHDKRGKFILSFPKDLSDNMPKKVDSSWIWILHDNVIFFYVFNTDSVSHFQRSILFEKILE